MQRENISPLSEVERVGRQDVEPTDRTEAGLSGKCYLGSVSSWKCFFVLRVDQDSVSLHTASQGAGKLSSRVRAGSPGSLG